jgi:hypothetical protein
VILSKHVKHKPFGNGGGGYGIVAVGFGDAVK